MKRLKYIITDKRIPVIFSCEMIHNEVLQSGISAGFLILTFNSSSNEFCVKCYGESTSLNLKMAKEDQSIITHYLNNQFLNLSKSVSEVKVFENGDLV